MSAGKAIALSLTLVTTVAGCGQIATGDTTDIAAAALSAARAGNIEIANQEGRRLRAVESPSCGRGLRRAAAKLEEIAAYNASKKSAEDAGAVLSSGIQIPSDAPRETCNRTHPEARLKSAIDSIDAEALRVTAAACAIILERGPASASILAVGTRRQRPFTCQGAPSQIAEAMVRSYAAHQLEGTGIMHLVNPLSCVKGSGEQVSFEREYVTDVEALGTPASISISEGGVAATWPHGYQLFGSQNPNLVRRTLGPYPSIEDVRTMTASDGRYFSESAVDAVRSSCLSEPEVSRVLRFSQRN